MENNTIIDLRSDTLTRPDQAMREAMFTAEVGDDVFGEDPTINKLEEKAAGLLGREAAVFVPSGTMANQIALKTLTQTGEEVIIESGAHPFMYEGAGGSVISSIQFHPLTGKRGLLDPDQVKSAIRPDDVHQPRTGLVCLENTHNRGGGSIYPLDQIAAVSKIARDHGINMHLDGARLFNACVASGLGPDQYARYFDTVCFCLSKGLGAPVGSILVSDGPLISKARRWRKMLGGGMRQAGILAAAGIYALDNNVTRLKEDHDNAQALARGIAGIDGLDINPEEVETNIVIFRITRPGLKPDQLFTALYEKGVFVLPFGHDKIRAVTRMEITRSDIDNAVLALQDVMK